MRKPSPDADVPRSAEGPFLFLKPTTILIGHRDEVRIAPGCERVEREVELAVVIGDVICTGTGAGVGAGKNRFLSHGDVMVAEVEGIGRLEHPVMGG